MSEDIAHCQALAARWVAEGRVDAMAWRERFGIHGRCKCDPCERLWQKSRPA